MKKLFSDNKIQLVFLFLILICFQSIGQNIRINEFVSSNNETIHDEDGDYEDWIELYNAGSVAVNLLGWGLSDNPENPFRWVFPDKTLQPGAFIVIWASGKDRTLPQLHTNFSISSTGEHLVLYHPSGQQIDYVEPVELPSDISYGRYPDGTDQWLYFSNASPGAANGSDGYSEILVPPVFSVSGGLYHENQLLYIVHPDLDASIVYTLDGSEPTLEATETIIYHYKDKYIDKPEDEDGTLQTAYYQSLLYDSPIVIENRIEEPDMLTQIATTYNNQLNYVPSQPVSRATVIRARAFKAGALPSEVETQTFFIGDQTQFPSNLPVVSLSLNPDGLFDYERGIYVAGIDFDQWRKSFPQERAHGGSPANYHRRENSEISAHFEFFEAGHLDKVFQSQVGLRIHGGWSRSFPIKSLRVYARDKERELRYPFFPELPFSSYKRLVLRNSGNDFYSTYLRDASMQLMMKHLNFDTQAYRPSVVFINGEYWGIHNIRERYDRHYLERVYGIDSQKIDMLTGYGDVIEGSAANYHQTRDYIANNDMTVLAHYQEVESRIDLENFIDYKIANIFLCNTDWPAGNISYWRTQDVSTQPDAPFWHDGRWRWMMYDVDFGFGLMYGYQHNTLVYATDSNSSHYANPPWSTVKLRKLLLNEDFRTRFINRFADQLNSAFLSERLIGVIDSCARLIETEMPMHIRRWSRPDHMYGWYYNLDQMREFALQRPHHQRNHIVEYFRLAGTTELTVDLSHPLHGKLIINTLDLSEAYPGISSDPYPWTGIYFKDIPITLQAIAKPGYRFSHWEGDIQSGDSILTLLPQQINSITARFIPVEPDILAYYWLFDDTIPNNTPLETLIATYNSMQTGWMEFQSALPGYPYFPGHGYWRKSSLERKNDPTYINYRPEGNTNPEVPPAQWRGIQMKAPFQFESHESALIFHVPSHAIQDVVFKFAARDDEQKHGFWLDYSVSDQTSWIPFPDYPIMLTHDYQPYEFNFSSIKEINNNSDFKIRIRVWGNATSTDSRVSFNNFSLDGVLCNLSRISADVVGNGSITPSGKLDAFSCSPLHFHIVPSDYHVLKDLLLDNSSVLDQVITGPDGSGRFILDGVVRNHSLVAVFDILVPTTSGDDIAIYPNPVRDVFTISSDFIIRYIAIYDFSGRKILMQDVNDRNFSFNLYGYNPGLYVLHLGMDDKNITRKIMLWNK